MHQLRILAIIAIGFLSCKTKIETKASPVGIQLIMSDTTNNYLALWDLEDLNRRLKLENQIGLSDLRNGVDSLEVRVWSEGAFSSIKELCTLKLKDTACLVSYYRIYPRESEGGSMGEWNPFDDPIVDSVVSKSVRISKTGLEDLHPDSIWLLKSESELKIPGSIGFLDCNMNVLEIADKRRFKYLRYHCPNALYNKMKLSEIEAFLDYFGRIKSFVWENNVNVPYHYD